MSRRLGLDHTVKCRWLLLCTPAPLTHQQHMLIQYWDPFSLRNAKPGTWLLYLVTYSVGLCVMASYGRPDSLQGDPGSVVEIHLL